MNVLFFITPKSQVKYIETTMSVRQVLEIFEFYRYTTLPILSEDGRYAGSISEGDLLFYLKNTPFKTINDFNQINIMSFNHYKSYISIKIDANMEDLIFNAINQNFVPIVDDNDKFIGMVTRKSIINYLYGKAQENNLLK